MTTKVTNLIPLIKAVYASENGGAGCCLHLVTDDDNYDCAEFCLNYAQECEVEEPGKHQTCIKAAEMMTQMTLREIKSAVKRSDI